MATVTIVGTPLSVDPPVAPNVCRLSAFFRDMTGAALVNYGMRFNTAYAVLTADGVGVQEPALVVSTDTDGRLVVDLLRGIDVHVTFPDRFDLPLSFTVPDVASADLFDYLYPHAVSVALAPAAMILPVAGESPATATATLSNGETVDVTDHVTWASDDELVATVSESGLVSGVGAGMAQISASALDSTKVEEVWDPTTQEPWALIPTPPIAYGAAISVTVA